MLELMLLGGSVLKRDGSPVSGVPAQRHHLALLALLAASPGQCASREKLVAYLWPESDAGTARHRLSVAIHVLRRRLGRDFLAVSGDALGLNLDAVRVDVAEFMTAIAGGRLEEGVATYAGPFLDGFYLSGAPEFERWVDTERDRLAGLFAASLRRLMDVSVERGMLDAASQWSRRLAAHDPFSAAVAMGHMRALAAVGDSAGALRHSRAYAVLVQGDLGIAPDAAVLELARRIAMEENADHMVIATDPADQARHDVSVPVGPPPHTEDASLAGRLPRRPPGLVRRTALVIGLVAVTTLLAVRVLGRSGDSVLVDPHPGVAVLPFMNPDRDSALMGLGAGLADGVRSTLAFVPNIRLRAAPVVANRRVPTPRRVGRSIQAAFVVSGTIRRDEDQTFITAQLIDVPTGALLWSKTFTRHGGDLAGLQQELSMTIADDLRLQIAPYQPKTYTASDRAYDRFLQGVYSHRQFTSEHIWMALQFYREAYEDDPSFALAHAIAANAYIDLTTLGLPEEVGLERAREQVLTALALDSSLAEGQAALGYIQIWRDRDFVSGERSLRRAIMLYPTLPQARDWYGRYALFVRSWSEVAVTQVRLALEVDPLNTARSHMVESILYLARRYDEVPEQNQITTSLDANVAQSFRVSHLGGAYRELGKYDEAITEFQHLQARTGARVSAGLALTYARMGRAQEARAILRELETRAASGSVSYSSLARVYAGLGDFNRAFHWLERTFEAQPSALLVLGVDPTFDPLRSDHRFVELLRKMGLASSTVRRREP
jgi:DNA-binding SARP family transcriptional activator/TolB-like protein/Tfp pilus assembly protein PilF